MKSFLTETRLILIFFVTLTIITIFSNFDFDSEQTATVKSFHNINNEAGGINSDSSRAPASVNENDSLTLSKEFLCQPLENMNRDKTSKNIVMISFKLCRESNLINNIALKNHSNGFVAHIFKLEENNFKTDYIQLNNGLNQLTLEVVLKDGQKLVESLEILSNF